MVWPSRAGGARLAYEISNHFRMSAEKRGMNRREFLKYLAAVSASTALGYPYTPSQAAASERPNFLVLLTDQERWPMHWPQGFAEQYLTSWDRLKNHGLTFNRAYCPSTQCSPSRACLMTGQYSNINQVPTLDFPGGLPAKSVLPNIGSWLAEKAGYEVVWKGKWHLSYPVGFEGGPPYNEVWTEADVAAMQNDYGLNQWNPPEAGNNVSDNPKALATMGGGAANNDGRYVSGVTSGDPNQTQGLGQSALDYIRQLGATPPARRPPFCLFISLVNPHDIVYFPNGWSDGGYSEADFDHLNISLPPNFDDDLSTKPSIQKVYYDYLQEEGPMDGRDQVNYVNFYAYLHTVVNSQIETILDAMDAAGLTRDTIIIRGADHGEFGLSHGLREKSYAAYEEIIHLPLTISNPVLFPKPVRTDAFYSHVDLAATMAQLAGAPALGVGRSQVPVIMDPGASVRDDVLFAFDDCFFLPCDAPASHIRALRNDRYTYAVYYSADGSAFEYELYDNLSDPNQLTNLAFEPSAQTLELWTRLHARLSQSLQENLAAPEGFAWPSAPIRPRSG
jgi:choline-sulfatase